MPPAEGATFYKVNNRAKTELRGGPKFERFSLCCLSLDTSFFFLEKIVKVEVEFQTFRDFFLTSSVMKANHQLRLD